MTRLKPQINPAGLHGGCLNCSSATMQLDLNRELSMGFGWIEVTRDGVAVLYGDSISSGRPLPHPHYGEDGWLCWEHDHVWTGWHVEAMAAYDANHDWRILLEGPLHGEVFQRHSAGVWRCIESKDGFA